MSEFELDRFRCPKLTDENWKPWSALVKTHLESKDLLETIMVQPTGSQKVDAIKDATARTIIMMHARMVRIGYILGLNTAFKQWETLRKVHDENHRSNSDICAA
jgi:hypothetical protein